MALPRIPAVTRPGQEELMLAATLGHTDILTKQMELGVCSEVNSAELA